LSALAFSASTLLAGRQEEHPARKNCAMRCWYGYLSGVRCKWFAYGAADSTATPKSGSLTFLVPVVQVVLEKRLLNGRQSVFVLVQSVCFVLHSWKARLTP